MAGLAGHRCQDLLILLEGCWGDSEASAGKCLLSYYYPLTKEQNPDFSTASGLFDKSSPDKPAHLQYYTITLLSSTLDQALLAFLSITLSHLRYLPLNINVSCYHLLSH